MKLAELRIGNIVQSRFIGKVVYITREGIHIDPSGFEYLNRSHIKDQQIAFLEIAGVPLSEAWLTKFGFERNTNKDVSDSFFRIKIGDSDLHINPDDGVVWVHSPDNNIFNIPTLIHYVHELQNLYSSFTGERLTIKE